MEEEEFDAVQWLIDYESDAAMTPEEELLGFAYLIRTGLAYSLQGHYGRMAESLIDAGLISRSGEVLGGLPC